jgi:hypothetical protein
MIDDTIKTAIELQEAENYDDDILGDDDELDDDDEPLQVGDDDDDRSDPGSGDGDF